MIPTKTLKAHATSWQAGTVTLYMHKKDGKQSTEPYEH